MNILEQHQVVCTIILWFKKIYIIVNIFVNTQSILTFIASKCNFFNNVCLCKKNITTMLKLSKSIKVTSCTTEILTNVLLSRYMYLSIIC